MVNTTDNDKNSLLDSLAEFGKILQESLDQFDRDSDAAWNSLDKEQQLLLFCAVVKRIHRGEITERQSYRGVLYDVFEFGPEAYIPAQHSGYLDIHNMLFHTPYNTTNMDKSNDVE